MQGIGDHSHVTDTISKLLFWIKVSMIKILTDFTANVSFDTLLTTSKKLFSKISYILSRR